MAEILHFEILRKHGQTNTQTHKQTHKHTNRHGHYNTSPSPYFIYLFIFIEPPQCGENIIQYNTRYAIKG